MADATDLRAVARKRIALIRTARATAAGAFNHQPVAQSQPIGNATVRHSCDSPIIVPSQSCHMTPRPIRLTLVSPVAQSRPV